MEPFGTNGDCAQLVLIIGVFNALLDVYQTYFSLNTALRRFTSLLLVNVYRKLFLFLTLNCVHPEATTI